MEIVKGLQYFCKKKFYLNISQFDTDTTFLIKKLFNQLFASFLFPINTALKQIKQMNFKSCLKFLSTFNVPEVLTEPCKTPEMDRFVKIVKS